MQVYAPTSDSSEADIDWFYAQLTWWNIGFHPKKDIKIVQGDWNAKTGSVRDGERRHLVDTDIVIVTIDGNVWYNGLLIRGLYTSETADLTKNRTESGRGYHQMEEIGKW